jgi:hypothetical protein
VKITFISSFDHFKKMWHVEAYWKLARGLVKFQSPRVLRALKQGHYIQPTDISRALDPVKITFISSFDLISKKRGM